MTTSLTPYASPSDLAVSSQEAIDSSVQLWASSTTDPDTSRLADLLRDKQAAVRDFFLFARKRPQDVSPLDVREWQEDLTARGLSSATVYSRVSMLSSYYKWLMQDEALQRVIQSNPVDLARPKPPKAYQKAQALSDEDLDSLVQTLTAAAAHSLTGKRDYAMFLFYILTGHRREEVCRLSWGDLKRNGRLTVRFLVKGGDYVTEQVNMICYEALEDYLAAAGRLASMTPDSPLWVGHDRAGQATGQLSSHSFAKNLKRYARLAGLEDIHVHQLRHTVARLVGEDTGDMTAVQRVLGHKNLQTTRVYAQRVMVKSDSHSQAIARRLGLEG
jgi:integrase/recombinase XerC